MMIGILVHGNNHFLVRGLLPDWHCRYSPGSTSVPRSNWSYSAAFSLRSWRISTQGFREQLEWAVVVPGDSEPSPAVTQLPDELSL